MHPHACPHSHLPTCILPTCLPTHMPHAHCHDLISLFYYFPLFYILISSFQPFSQLWNCFYCVVGSVSQAIFVLPIFHSPFGQYLMGIFLKYWASSCNSLACLSLVIDTLVQYCSLGTPEFTASWYCYHLGPFECSPRPPVLSGFPLVNSSFSRFPFLTPTHPAHTCWHSCTLLFFPFLFSFL